MKHRLQKLLAQANLGSRRATEEFITAGRVKVNGEVAILGTKADPDTDVVTLDGERLNLTSPPVYIAYYKPINVISAMESQPGDDRPTVREMIPVDGHLFSLGRLDVESEGLLILTNDGDLTNTLTHPRYEHTKTYQVTVYGTPDSKTLERWERGVVLSEEDGTEIETAPCYIEIIRRDGDTTLLKVVMTEGRNRQIRRVAAMLGHPVKALLRTHIGRYGLGKLKRGEYADMSEQDLRLLTTSAPELEDIKKLKSQVNNANRRARYLSVTTATPEQIEEAKRNKPSPAPRPGKKYAARDSRSEGRGNDDRPRRPSGGANRRSGPPDGKRPGSKPMFRSRLMLDETGRSTPGAKDHGKSDTPEGFRSRLGETDRRPRQGDGGDDRPVKTYGKSDTPAGFRSRLGEADRPKSRSSSDRTSGPRRPFNREGGDSRPPRRDGDSRPPRREGSSDDRPRGPRPEGERSASGDRPRRPFNREGGDSRPPRRDGDSRPPRREGSSDDRPRGPRPEGERSASGDRPRRPFNREGGDSRPPRRDGDSRPPRREGSSDDRPRGPRPEGERSASGDRPRRPFNREGGDSRPPRRDGDSRPPRREGSSDDRPRGPRPEGERSAGGDRPRRPFNREGGDSRPPRRDGDSRPPRREGSSDDRPRGPRPEGERSASGDRPRRTFNREGGDSRPPRRDGDSRPPRREGSSDDRPRGPRPDDRREQRSSGERSASGDRPRRTFNREGGDSRPPRRDGDSRPPRREGSSDDRPRGPRPEGSADRPRRPRPEGERSSSSTGGEQRERRPAPRRDGDKRPAGSGDRSSGPLPRRGGLGKPAPRRDSTAKPPRRESSDIAPKKRDDDDE